MKLSEDMSNDEYVVSALVYMWEVAARNGNYLVKNIIECEYHCMTNKQLPGGDYRE